jgi:UDP-N-acetylglucosamine 2-epimerase (non-hydrolysing)
MAPVMLALRKRTNIAPVLIATGQHGALFDDALRVFGLTADHRLELPASNHEPDVMASLIQERLTPFIADLSPDLILVQGDTTSALAAARTAVSRGVALGHVEAGLRSHDLQRPWPEEGNRIAIDRLATLLFTPTERNMANLAADPLVKGDVHLTGNSGIDALNLIHTSMPPGVAIARGPKHVLVTLHRREVIGESLRAICGTLRRLADRGDVKITLPLHPNPHVRSIIAQELGGHGQADLIEPLDYRAMIARMCASDLILSDSGGVQEEAPALGVPLLILRDVTERQEAVECGAALLTGTNPEDIFAQASHLLDNDEARRKMAIPRFPFGSGDAAEKIAAIIENHLDRKT